jgi:hypothetical protein
MIWSNRMTNKSEQAWHSNEEDNQSTYRISGLPTTSVLRVRLEWNPWVDWGLTEYNGKEMWASVTFIGTRQTEPRTERQRSQQRQFSEFARNGTRELIISWWNRMVRKCEQAWHSNEQDRRTHVPSHSSVNEAISPSSLGVEPVSWLVADWTEWQGNVSKLKIHKNKIHQSTYRATAESTTSVLRVRSEWNPSVDYKLMEQIGKVM